MKSLKNPAKKITIIAFFSFYDYFEELFLLGFWSLLFSKAWIQQNDCYPLESIIQILKLKSLPLAIRLSCFRKPSHSKLKIFYCLFE